MKTNNEYIWEALVASRKHIDGTAWLFSQRTKPAVLYSIDRAITIMQTLCPEKFEFEKELSRRED